MSSAVLGRVVSYHHHQHHHPDQRSYCRQGDMAGHIRNQDEHVLSYHPRLHGQPSCPRHTPTPSPTYPTMLKSEPNTVNTGTTAKLLLQQQQTFNRAMASSASTTSLSDYPSPSQPLLPLILSYGPPATASSSESGARRHYSPSMMRRHTGAVRAAHHSQYNSGSGPHYQHASPYSRVAASG